MANYIHLVLFGPPGAGKGTQSEKLIDQYNLMHISTGDLFRKHLSEGTVLGKKAKSYMDAGDLVPDEVVIGMVDDKLSQGMNGHAGVIFDGFPRTVAQAKALDELLEEKGNGITGMISLEVPEEELVKRIKHRGQTSGRADDQDEAKIQNRLNVYKEETLPVADYYNKQGKLKTVDGVGSIDGIFGAIAKEVDNLA